MKANFYDIESLSNAFTLCNYKPSENRVDVFCLVDNGDLIGDDLLEFKRQLTERVLLRNKNFNGVVRFYDLHGRYANDLMAKTFGLSDANMINNPTDFGSYPTSFRIVCDTDPNYNEDEHPYLMGYNSYNYDTTMLSLYFSEAYVREEGRDSQGRLFRRTRPFEAITAKQMRSYNNELFTKRFKDNMPSMLTYIYDNTGTLSVGPSYDTAPYKIRKNMLMSGRHLDVARLNEKQQKVGLKRLLGMLGYQILESDKLTQDKDTLENTDELLDLIAYNVSDCVNLEKLFNHPLYFGQFTLKKGLLETYPELIYQKQDREYKPDIRPECVRRDRLTIDSSSAQFSTKSLCPYNHLTDIPTVSFMYPSEEKAEELNIKRVNVLEESKKFFYSHFEQPELRAKFDEIYNYYKSIEGKNFNESNNYRNDYGPNALEAHNLSELDKINTCMFYYNKDGTPSSCFVTFSTGGIHGAEYNKELFESDLRAFEQELEYFKYAKAQYPVPTDLRKDKKIVMPDGTEFSYTHFLKSGATLKKAEYKDIESKRPCLFKQEKSGAWKIHPKYVFTSADLTNHEDFTSYYPNMLRMMSAFYNKWLGYDRYAEIFENKQKYGKLMKDKSISKEEREYYDILRNGTKLILNSASGAADANFESNIRMNNQIISMRIIGQLFSWRIGQAQTIGGARIISTNTDGLYSVLEEHLNNLILENESKSIGVEIEPEPCFLISKDSNNRTEIKPDFSSIIEAKGGTLSCRRGPTPAQSLAHPAITDWALTEYLIEAASNPKLSLFHNFDIKTGQNIIERAKKEFEPVKLLNMFQNVIASSIGSINYIFGTTDANPDTPIILQHYNRVFIMKDKTPNTMHLHAANAKKLTPATIAKRKRNYERMQQHDPTATSVLLSNGVHIKDLSNDKEAVVKKVTNIDDSWYMLIENRNLSELSDSELRFIIDNLDYDRYLQILADGFAQNWQNNVPAQLKPFVDLPCTLSLQNESTNMSFNITDLTKLRQIYNILN